MELIGDQIDVLLQGRAIRSPGPLAQIVVGLGLGLAGALAGVGLRAAPSLWLAVSLSERETTGAYPGAPRPRVMDEGEIQQRKQRVRNPEQLTPKTASNAAAAALILILGNRGKESTDEPRPPVGAAGLNFPRDRVR